MAARAGAPRPAEHPADRFRLDRISGVLLGAACGDALGVPYEFARRLTAHETPHMLGGGLGPYAPGEYSDDTQMAVCLAQVTAGVPDLLSTAALNGVAENFLTWRREGATDIGDQTRAILDEALPSGGTPEVAARMLAAAAARYASGAPGAGNGSLMRTAPIALAYPHDPRATAELAALYGRLTHADPLAEDACVLWCEGIRQAVDNGGFEGVRNGLALLPEERRAQWAARLDQAETRPPHAFSPNGFVVSALQAAYSAIMTTPVPESRPAEGVFAADHFRLALENAVRAGDDTDTVAAIAGALLGARWGVSAVPWQWQRAVHGWPGIHSRDLISLAVRTATNDRPNAYGWPHCRRHPHYADVTAPFSVAHPHDPGVVLGNLRLAQPWAGRVDAVVSLCATGSEDFAEVPRADHIQIWLVDLPGENAHDHFAVEQAARAVAGLRDEGRTVLLHCAAGRSRTPAVAARYAAIRGVDTARALAEVMAALAPNAPRLNSELRRFVFELAGRTDPDPGADHPRTMLMGPR
ncbi:ADP-ribosylglycohydrolase [Murinocardiopsis flavida]|uniref:ADP-ribosylglycohydrolase n=1 Tax=Murinocardiopsis flavida TaxID=645275 RepID=A0A2P8DDT9_9ACTN|nr:ADP-ribosylglycohydrolase [Murinocardiopsis flavida]